MKIYYDINEIDFDSNRAVAIGSFDGIHRGHKKILDTLFTKANQQNLKKFVITFEPTPKKFFNKNSNFTSLTTIKEKIKILNQIGIDEILIMDFNENISQLNATDFLELVFNKIGFKIYVIGENHTFGRNGKGNLDILNTFREKKNNCFEVCGVKSYLKNNQIISTTLIKKLILTANIEGINELLGYNYFIVGEVVSGDKIGRQLGFPTANIEVSNGKIIPKNGVYLVQIELKNDKHFGVANIGNRPTIKTQFCINKPYIEVHIFDFCNDIYGQELTISFLKYIRAEQKFNDTNELAKQISQDIDICKAFLSTIFY